MPQHSSYMCIVTEILPCILSSQTVFQVLCESYINYSISVHHAMHAFISARQRTCTARMGFWVSVCGSSGFLHQVCELPTFLHTYLLFVPSTCTLLVLYIYTDILHPQRVIPGPRKWVSVRIIIHHIHHTHHIHHIHHSRAILHQSCSTFHPQPHTSLGFPQSHPSCSPSWLQHVSIHQNSCAQFCHGYYIAFDYHDRSRSLNHFQGAKGVMDRRIYITLERKQTEDKKK